MRGFLVINAYCKSEKFELLHRHLVSSAKDCKITLDIRTNEEMLFEEERRDFVLFWDKDTCLAGLLENRGIPVFNSAQAIALCDDKAKTYLALEGIVPQPETLIAPLSFYGADYSAFVKKAASRLGLPLVYKERCGSFGEQVFLCKREEEILSHINGRPFLLQRFIADSCGEDIRIEVVGDRVIAAMKRTNKNDFRSNLTNGGTAAPYTPTDEEAALAVNACRALGLTFGGADILRGGLVCEVNSNAHIINLLNITGIDAAKAIFEEIKMRI